jgi:release factor glutamine methyltransferase
VSPRTVAVLRREIARSLASASASPGLDARLIVAHAAGIAPDAIVLCDADPVTDTVAAAALALAKRRASGEPVARLLGEKEFYGLAFRLTPDTLIPRPDTETLVDAVLAAVDRDAPLAILDLGTGSGAILIALLKHLPHARGVGVDLAEGAIGVARDNAARHGVAGRSSFVTGGWDGGPAHSFDVVVSNPPYIARGEIAALPVDVRDHDPHLALDGGPDGLDAYRAIIPALPGRLSPGGRAFLEAGFGQGPDIARLAADARFACAFRNDLAGIARVAVLSRKNP